MVDFLDLNSPKTKTLLNVHWALNLGITMRVWEGTAGTIWDAKN